MPIRSRATERRPIRRRLYRWRAGPEALGPVRPVAVKGRSLFWYGPAMLKARDELEAALLT